MAVFIVLLTLLQVSSALYGPRLLIGEVGGSVTIKCIYPTIKANRYSRKYWCKISGPGSVCNSIISTSPFTSTDHKERASITDFPKNGTFTVQMTQLEQKDTGAYRCGIGRNNNVLFVSVNLTVLEGSNVPKSPDLVLGELRGSVTIHCQSENITDSGRKYWCKLGKTGCTVIADSTGYVGRNYEGRISITSEESSGTFKILINRLKMEDSGLYKCGVAMLGHPGNARTIDLQVTKESTIPGALKFLSGAEGGWVSAKCHYNPQRNYEIKYWCRWTEVGCSLMVDTSGFIKEAHQGRIQIISDNQENGTFTVVMSQLEEVDAGWYWCGAKDGETEQTSSMKLHIQKRPRTFASGRTVSPPSGPITSASGRTGFPPSGLVTSASGHTASRSASGCTASPPSGPVTSASGRTASPPSRPVTSASDRTASPPSGPVTSASGHTASTSASGRTASPPSGPVTSASGRTASPTSGRIASPTSGPVTSASGRIASPTSGPVTSASGSTASPTSGTVTSASGSTASPTSAISRIPNHVSVIDQTYPMSTVTEGILEKTSDAKFATVSNAVHVSSSTSELQFLPIVMTVLVLLFLVLVIILIFIKVKRQKKKELNRRSIKNLEATVNLTDLKFLDEQMLEENMDLAKPYKPKMGDDKEHSSPLMKDPGGLDENLSVFLRR
ncbi:polymeric immunoglobulin receptor-like isoform X1 [Pelodiscus sinensis]|uniref:polymeric immunoglobulin receptor-like isoform X1 n=1 Tax=Pelodiscus sinensis TaxID=13735 RepID=UPI003F6AF844